MIKMTVETQKVTKFYLMNQNMTLVFHLISLEKGIGAKGSEANAEK